MARSQAGEAAWRRQQALRCYALEPLRQALADRTQTGLVRQINERARLDVTPRMMSFYLSGYTRWPRAVFAEACRLAGKSEWDVLKRVDDESVLLQPLQPKRSARKRQTASA